MNRASNTGKIREIIILSAILRDKLKIETARKVVVSINQLGEKIFAYYVLSYRNRRPFTRNSRSTYITYIIIINRCVGIDFVLRSYVT